MNEHSKMKRVAFTIDRASLRSGLRKLANIATKTRRHVAVPAAIEKGRGVGPAQNAARPSPSRESRAARRKRETRARLLEAAFGLMAARGADAVAIQEITEAADVATGAFYNYFKSKDEIYLEVTRRVFEDFADALDGLVADLDDPAEVIAVCIRQTLLRARSEPLWGQFLMREGLSAYAANRGLGRRLRRDIARGVASGRFESNDSSMAFVATGGAVLAAVSAQLHGHTPEAKLGERIAVIALRILGLTRSEAARVANKRMPEREQSSP